MGSAVRWWRIGIAAKLAVYLVLGTGAVFLMFAIWNVRCIALTPRRWWPSMPRESMK